jgi:DNA-binding Lrp family transcriptional regulator
MFKCELGKTYEVANDLVDNIPQVSEIHSISGEFDLLVKFYLEKDADIGHFVSNEVQTRPNIRDTYTLIAHKVFT